MASTSAAANGEAAATSTDNTVVNLPDPSSLKNLVTEYPIDANFDPNAFYADEQFNGWFPLLEKYVDTIMDECQRYVTLHEDASKLYNTRYQIITISLIIIPLLSGFVTFLNLSSTLTRIANGIFALLGVALGSFNKVMKFSELSSIHRISRDKYMKLNGTIAEQLFLPMLKRYNGVLFERWCRNTFFSIKELAPYPERRKRTFWGKRKKSDIPLRPTEASITVPPEVAGDQPPEAGSEMPVEVPPEENTEAIARYREYLQTRRTRATFRG